MRNYVRGIVALSALCLSFGLAEAENKTFENPMIGTNRLDWCANWGKGCGAEAATAWCKTNAYDHSVDVQQAPDIGASAPTKLIATGEVCDQSYCDGFYVHYLCHGRIAGRGAAACAGSTCGRCRRSRSGACRCGNRERNVQEPRA